MNPKQKRKLKRNIKLNYLNAFITNINMQSSVWVLYLAYCGMNLTEIGMIEGIYHITSILFEIPSGALADLLGRKKSMVLSRICIAVSCMIMLFFKSFFFFALSFFIQALGNNLNSGSEEALIYDSMKSIGQENRYLGVSGRRNLMIEVAQGIATVTGGILAEYSYFWCYSACLCIAGLALLPVLFMTEPPYTETDKTKKQIGITEIIRYHFLTCFRILKSDPRILQMIGYYSVLSSAYTLLFFYSQQYYADINYNKIQISMILLLVSGASCFGAAVSEKLFKRSHARFADLTRNKMVFIAAILLAITFIIYGFKNPMAAIPAFAIAGFCDSAIYPIESETLNLLIPSEQRATLISVDSMFFSIAMIIIFPAAGAAADRFGLSVIFPVIGTGLLFFIKNCHLPEY